MYSYDVEGFHNFRLKNRTEYYDGAGLEMTPFDPDRALAARMIVDAMQSLYTPEDDTKPIVKRLRENTLKWFNGEMKPLDGKGPAREGEILLDPFSFENCCAVLNFPVDETRKKILNAYMAGEPIRVNWKDVGDAHES